MVLRDNADVIGAGFDASARGAQTMDGDLLEETDTHLSLRAALIAHYQHAVGTDTLLRLN